MNAAKFIALILAAVMILLGLAALAVPDRVLPFAQFTTTTNGVYVAAGIRLGIGLILLFAAAGSRFPRILRVLGALVIIGGIATLFLGSSGAQMIASRLATNANTMLRGVGVFVLIVGCFIMYAVTGSKPQRRLKS